MTVDPETIEWLRSRALFVTDEATGALGEDLSVETEIISCIALEGNAINEADRQQAFLAGPLAIETHLVDGLQASLIGQPITLTINRLGYDAGLIVFVIAAEEQDDVRQTLLTVLRRMT